MGLCLDANTGKERWRKELADGYQWDKSSNLASPSPVTDGERVIFFFATGDLSCFDFNGKELWKRQIAKEYGNFATVEKVVNFRTPAARCSDGETPLRIQVLQAQSRASEFQGAFTMGVPNTPNDSYLLCIDPKTGQNSWDSTRSPSQRRADGNPRSSSFPRRGLRLAFGSKRVMLVLGRGRPRRRSDPATGEELWR